MSNTYKKLNERTVRELEGLSISTIQDSARNVQTGINIEVAKSDSTHNTYTRLRDRVNNELEKVNYSVLEISQRNQGAAIQFGVFTPKSTHSKKLNLYRKYTKKVEV